MPRFSASFLLDTAGSAGVRSQDASLGEVSVRTLGQPCSRKSQALLRHFASGSTWGKSGGGVEAFLHALLVGLARPSAPPLRAPASLPKKAMNSLSDEQPL